MPIHFSVGRIQFLLAIRLSLSSSLAVNKKLPAVSWYLGFSIGKLATKAASLIRENKPIKPERDNNDVNQSFQNLI